MCKLDLSILLTHFILHYPFGGMISALSVVLMFSSNIITVGLYILPAAAGTALYILRLISGKSCACSAFAAVSVLSLLFCTEKECALFFILFLGYYPMVREQFHKIKPKIVSLALKLVLFNAATVLIYWIMRFVFLMPAEEFEMFGIELPLIFLVLLNIVFLLYDRTLTLYEKRYAKKVIRIVTKLFKN